MNKKESFLYGSITGLFVIGIIIGIAYFGSYAESEKTVESCKEFGIAKMLNDIKIKCEIITK